MIIEVEDGEEHLDERSVFNFERPETGVIIEDDEEARRRFQMTKRPRNEKQREKTSQTRRVVDKESGLKLDHDYSMYEEKARD